MSYIKAGAAIVAPKATESSKGKKSAAKQRQQQHKRQQDQQQQAIQARETFNASLAELNRGDHKVSDEVIRTLLASLQSSIAAQDTLKDTIMCTESLASSNYSDETSSTGTGISNENLKTKFSRCRPWMVLDIVELIREEGYDDRVLINYQLIAEKYKERILESHKGFLEKLIKVRDQLKARVQKQLERGDRFEVASSGAAVAAMMMGVAVALDESTRLLAKLSTASEMKRGFMALRCNVKDYREKPFHEVLDAIQEDLNRRLDRRGFQSNDAESSSAAGSIPSTLPRTMGSLHQQHLVDVAQFAVLEGLFTPFPLLHQAVKKFGVKVREDKLGLPEGDIERAMNAAIRSDTDLQCQLSLQFANRNAAEKMVSDAMADVGLPPFVRRRRQCRRSPRIMMDEPTPSRTNELVSSDEDLTDDDEY